MKWLNKLERKYGKYAIPNLMFYVVILYVVGFVFDLIASEFYYNYLSLDMSAVLRGQIWRLVTFIIQPPATNLLFVIFTLYLYYMIGRQLEFVWGSFRFNLYYFMGVLFHIIAALLAHFIFPIALPMGTYYLNMSLFFAYAAIYPNQQFYLMGLIPIKVKWLAWIDAAYFGYTILQAFLPSYGGLPGVYGLLFKANALEAFVSILNFLVFFLMTRNTKRFSPKEIKRKQTYRKEVQQGRQEAKYANGAKHRCHVCGRTELDDENLEFRYCSKCNGNYEYCQEHLFTHEHVK